MSAVIVETIKAEINHLTTEIGKETWHKNMNQERLDDATARLVELESRKRELEQFLETYDSAPSLEK